MSRTKEVIDTYSPIGVVMALAAIASQPAWSPHAQHDAEVAVLSQRVNAMETYFVSLDSRERQNNSAVLLMLTEVKSALGRIEGKLEK